MLKLLTQDEVKARIKRLSELVEREYALKERLIGLKMSGPRDHVIEARKEHDAILAEIDRLRMEEQLPVMAELSDFTKATELFLGVNAHLKKKLQ
jgi:hypothetical protein